MKKKIILGIVFSILSFILYQSYIFYFTPTNNLKSIYLVPKDAVLVIETQEPIDNWSEISKSAIWKHLQKNTYFNELTSSLNGVNHVFNNQKKLIDFIGNRAMVISIHVIQKKKYDLLYIADLQKFSKLKILKKYLSSFVGKGYKVTKRKFHKHEIFEFYNKKDRSTLNISFIENQLIASFTHTLVEQAIDQYAEPVIGRDLQFIDINKKVGYDNMFRLYIQYKYMDKYLNCFFDKTDNLVKTINNSLKYSGFTFDLKSNNTIVADGFTNTNELAGIYIKALQKSGKGNRSIDNIAPKRTAMYLSFAFDSFDKFYSNFENIQKENKQQFKTYQDNLDQIQNYLDIDFKKNFISWIGNEIALLQIQGNTNHLKNEMAIVFKINDKKLAVKNLDFILEQIRKKSPVKFNGVTYKNYQIKYMSIKGFFKVFLGDLFKKIDKPYFTIIDDYLVFSNHPNTLKNIIDDYLGKETLIKSEDYQDFKGYFEKKSSVFAYLNTPILYKNLYSLADVSTRKQLTKNKDFIICFPEIGFQLTPYITMFESKLVINYQDPNIVKSKEQFKDKTLGPRNDNNNTSTPKNLLEITPIDLFKTPQITPSSLNDTEYIVRYKNNQIRIEVALKDGFPDGRYKEYYLNGELKLKGRFKNGKKHKTWKAYDKNGKLIRKKKF